MLLIGDSYRTCWYKEFSENTTNAVAEKLGIDHAFKKINAKDCGGNVVSFDVLYSQIPENSEEDFFIDYICRDSYDFSLSYHGGSKPDGLVMSKSSECRWFACVKNDNGFDICEPATSNKEMLPYEREMLPTSFLLGIRQLLNDLRNEDDYLFSQLF